MQVTGRLRGDPVGKLEIKQAHLLAGEGQRREREGQDQALVKQGDNASVIVVRGLLAVGMASAAVRDIDSANLMPVQPLVQLRARSQDREGRHQ
jgi:hypothetical protein